MLRVLLWSPKGAGPQYSGPGTSAFRLYARRNKGSLAVSLAHGFSGQQRLPDVFDGEALVWPLFGNDGSELRNRSTLSAPYFHARFLRAARTWLKRHAVDFDVFHGLTGFEYTVSPAAMTVDLGIPAFVKIAGYGAELTHRGLWSRMLGRKRTRQKLLGRVSGVIAISTMIVQELLTYGVSHERIAYIPNGVDTQRFRPALDTADRDQQKIVLGWPLRPTIVFVGGVVRRKQPHLAVQALALMAKNGVDCQLVLVGPEHEPDYSAEVRQLARESALADRVIWQGLASQVELVYRAADVFCLPSSGEGLPNALLEAMASGLPSVATAVSGVTDLLRDGRTGTLCSPEARSIAKGLRTYLLDETLRRHHGDEARQLTVNEYNADYILQQHERLFRGAIAGKAPGAIAPAPIV